MIALTAVTALALLTAFPTLAMPTIPWAALRGAAGRPVAKEIAMTVSDEERLARALLTRIAEPGDEYIGRLITRLGARGTVDAIRAGTPAFPLTPGRRPPAEADAGAGAGAGADPRAKTGVGVVAQVEAGGRRAGADPDRPPAGAPGQRAGAHPASWAEDERPFATARGSGADPVRRPTAGPGQRADAPGRRADTHPPSQVEAERRFAAWRARLTGVAPARLLAAAEAVGGRLVCPGDAEWPSQLDDLGDARPFALWVRGDMDLRFACLRSVAVVGSRSASSYGTHVAAELGAELAGRGWCVVSGGAFGIDAAAHRGALAADGATVAVFACGVDVPYPSAHEGLFADVARSGLLVSELPPGTTPTRHRFLIRNRAIAALTRGTVVVEAARRSGALNTARHARDLHRVVMAVPGPVTSPTSAGCHALLREHDAVCVTDAAEVLDLVGLIGDDLAPEKRGPVLERDRLDPVTRGVLEAVPARGGAGAARIAVSAGVDLDTVLARLGALSAGGFVERCPKGWRLRQPPGTP